MDSQVLISPGATIAEPSFTCFLRLPPEIQVSIWNWTLEPRVLELLFHRQRDDGSIMAFGGDSASLLGYDRFYTETGNPMAMEVCRCSRQAVISSYPLCFGSNWYPPQVRYNSKLDVVFINSALWAVAPLFFSLLNNDELTNLRYLAIDSDDFDPKDWRSPLWISGLGDELKRVVEGLKGLEELLVLNFMKIKVMDELPADNGKWMYVPVRTDKVVLFDEVPEVFANTKYGRSEDFHSLFPDWVQKAKVKNIRCVLGWRKSLQFVPDHASSKNVEDMIDYHRRRVWAE